MAHINFPNNADDWRRLKNGILAILNHVQNTPDDITIYDTQWAQEHDPKRLGMEHVCLPFAELHQAKLFVETLKALAGEHGIKGDGNVPTFEYRLIDRQELSQVQLSQEQGIIPIDVTPKAVVLINGFPKLMPIIAQLRDALFMTKSLPGSDNTRSAGN